MRAEVAIFSDLEGSYAHRLLDIKPTMSMPGYVHEPDAGRARNEIDYSDHNGWHAIIAMSSGLEKIFATEEKNHICVCKETDELAREMSAAGTRLIMVTGASLQTLREREKSIDHFEDWVAETGGRLFKRIICEYVEDTDWVDRNGDARTFINFYRAVLLEKGVPLVLKDRETMIRIDTHQADQKGKTRQVRKIADLWSKGQWEDGKLPEGIHYTKNLGYDDLITRGKGEATSHIVARDRLKWRNVRVIGDDENDYGMLELALSNGGYAFAPGNATSNVKRLLSGKPNAYVSPKSYFAGTLDIWQRIKEMDAAQRYCKVVARF